VGVFLLPSRFDFIVLAYNRATLPPFTGELVRGWFLSTIHKHDIDLFNLLHSDSGPRPYAIRILRPIGKRMKVSKNRWIVNEGDRLTFSVSILKDEIETPIFEILVSIEKIRFGTLICYLDHIEVSKLSFSDNPEEISSRIGLVFRTPTFFNIKGRSFPYLFPDPIRIFSNLSTLWNAFAPETERIATESLLDWVSRNIMIKSYKLITREARIEKTKLTGFKGRAELIFLNDEKTKTAIKLLRFAEFSNVGEKRTYGFGVVNFIPLERK